MISWGQGMKVAEQEAWRSYGRRNEWWFVYGKRLAPVVLVAAAVGVLGWAAHWLWNRAAGLLAGDVSLPFGPVLFIGALLLFVTVLAIRGRSGHIRSFGALMLTGAGILTAWGAFFLFVVGFSG